jgi:hypothetical protein
VLFLIAVMAMSEIRAWNITRTVDSRKRKFQEFTDFLWDEAVTHGFVDGLRLPMLLLGWAAFVTCRQATHGHFEIFVCSFRNGG